MIDSDRHARYERYEREASAIRKENKVHLKEFEDCLNAKGLSTRTIEKHLENVDFYINTYLLYEEANRIDAGCTMVDDFLGYFFIRKCMWSTPATIRQNAASLKKFYKCMLEKGHITKADFDCLQQEMKEGMPEWIEACEQYNNPSTPDPFFDLF